MSALLWYILRRLAWLAAHVGDDDDPLYQERDVLRHALHRILEVGG